MARLDPIGVSRILGYIKNWVTNALSGKANSSHNHTKSQITDFPTIPSSTSQLTNDSGFLTSHQDLSGYVPKSGGAVLNNTSWSRTTNDDYLLLNGGTTWENGAHIVLNGKNRASGGGGFVINAKNDSYQYSLAGGVDGSLTWRGTAISLNGHTHTKSQITDFPTIPSNTSQLTNDSGFITSSGSCNYANSSGNADTVDGLHAWQMQTLASTGVAHGSNEWLMQCQYNVDGDGYFKLYCGDKSVGTKVDRATNAGYTDWLRTSSHTDHLFHTEWDGSYFWTYVTAGDGGYRGVRVERSNSSGYADRAGSVVCDVPDGSYYAPLSGTIGSNDNYRIRAGGGNNAGELWIETADDGNEPIGFAQYTGTFASVTRSGYLLNSSGNTEFPGTLYSYNGAVIRRNGIPTPGWGMDANTQSVLQIRTDDGTEPSICLHRSGYGHIVLAEQGGQLGVHAQGGSFDRCNTESNTVLNGYRIYVG